MGLKSVALTTKSQVPATGGMPLISPEVVLSVNPSGSDPDMISHEEAVPPAASRIVLYDSSMELLHPDE